MTSDSKQLADAVNVAKEAVKDLDEPLKTEAFKILLDKLISGKGKSSVRHFNNAKHPRTKTRSKTGTAKVTSTNIQASSLKLGVGELQKLKTYCERFDLGGTEQVAFILANFVREHTDLKTVTAADIDYLYRQLISLKIKVKEIAKVNDIADWTRALNWLTVPSRKKEWLEKRDNGYIVSNSGLLRFNELESQAESKTTN